MLSFGNTLCAAQIQHKSQFLFHRNLPSQDFSIMTLFIKGDAFYNPAYN